jgi:hypothetical protein
MSVSALAIRKAAVKFLIVLPLFIKPDMGNLALNGDHLPLPAAKQASSAPASLGVTSDPH